MKEPRPTYDVAGELARYDERDNVCSREKLAPGSPEERAYHTLYPELEKIDCRLTAFINAASRPEATAEPLDSALYQAAFGPIAGLALPDVVDGPVAPSQVQGDPVLMSARMKALCLHLGAADVRIGRLNPAWVYSHRGSPPFFADYRPNPPLMAGTPPGHRDLVWGDPIEVPHQHAISMAFSQSRELVRTGGTPFSDLEVGRVYGASGLVAAQVASYIRGLGWPARAHHLRNYAVLVVPVATDAGLGELGRCGYLIHPRLDANLRLVTVTTNLPLALDPPVDLGIQDFCAKCRKCAVNCPAGAIPKGDKVVVRGVRKWQVDPVKCLLYWGHLGSGCTICQVVCPWSKPPTLFHRLVARLAINAPALRRALVWADDRVYGTRFRPASPPGWASSQNSAK